MGGDERHVSRTRTLYLNRGYELWRETKQGRRVEEEGFGHVIYVSQENAATCGGGLCPMFCHRSHRVLCRVERNKWCMDGYSDAGRVFPLAWAAGPQWSRLLVTAA